MATPNRDAALLWTLHQCLLRVWTLADASVETRERLDAIRSFAGDVSVLPSALFSTGSETVEVRAMAVGIKLFIHFVGNGSSHRLDLVTADYVKTHTESVTKSSNRQLSEIGHWVVNEEMLLWRLERGIFPVYANMQTRAHAQTKAAAELGRLPAQLFADLTQFLTAEEFGRVTISNKHLRGLASDDKLWKTYIQRDFPHALIANGCPMRDEYLQLQVTARRARQRHTEARRRQDGDYFFSDEFFNVPRFPIIVPPVRPHMPDLFLLHHRDRWIRLWTGRHAFPGGSYINTDECI